MLHCLSGSSSGKWRVSSLSAALPIFSYWHLDPAEREVPGGCSRNCFEYTVNWVCELDEGMAVLFHSIHSMIRAKEYEERRWYHALVIDCGGGTTDLTSGRFRIENNRVSYIIDLETRYENGDTNLGGNNLTYRILQLLKLRLTEELGFQTKEALFIGGAEEGKSAYEELERRYLQAEKWLPTRFKEYEGRSRYFYVKNNYYYLFELVKQVKSCFQWILLQAENIHE